MGEGEGEDETERVRNGLTDRQTRSVREIEIERQTERAWENSKQDNQKLMDGGTLTWVICPVCFCKSALSYN